MRSFRLPLLFATVLATATAAESVVEVGAGGYLTTAPKPCKPLPREIFRTAEVTGPMVTNQWWSSLVWQKHSQNMFAHPAFMRCVADGLVVGYPGARVHGNDVGIFGGADLGGGDLRIGHSEVDDFPRADCGGYSDWFVTAVFATDGEVAEGELRAREPFRLWHD